LTNVEPNRNIKVYHSFGLLPFDSIAPILLRNVSFIHTARAVCGKVYVTVRFPSVCLSHLSTATAACGGFAAVGKISIDCCTACAQQQRRRSSTAVNSKCEQCHVDSRRRRLNWPRVSLLTISDRHDNSTVNRTAGTQPVDSCTYGQHLSSRSAVLSPSESVVGPEHRLVKFVELSVG